MFTTYPVVSHLHSYVTDEDIDNSLKKMKNCSSVLKLFTSKDKQTNE